MKAQVLATAIVICLIAALAWATLDGDQRKALAHKEFNLFQASVELMLSDPITCTEALRGQPVPGVIRIGEIRAGAVFQNWALSPITARLNAPSAQDGTIQIEVALSAEYLHPWPRGIETQHFSREVKARLNEGKVVECL